MRCCCCCCSGPDARHRWAAGALEVEFNAAVELLVAAERFDTDLGTASAPATGGTGVAGPALLTPRRPPPFLRCIPLWVHPMLETRLTNAHPLADKTLRRPPGARRQAAAVVASG